MCARRGHTAMAMKTTHRRSVEAREPGLLPIKLPIDIPSIPVLDPLVKPALTQLVNGPGPATVTKPDPPTTTTPTAPPTNTGNGSGNGNGNGNDNGNGGGKGGSDSGGDNGNGSGSGNGGDSGSGGGNGDGSWSGNGRGSGSGAGTEDGNGSQGNGSGNSSGNGTGSSGSGGGGNTNTGQTQNGNDGQGNRSGGGGNNGNNGNNGGSQSSGGQTGGSGNADGSNAGQSASQQGQNNTPQRPPTIPGGNSSSNSVGHSDYSPASNPVFVAGVVGSQTASQSTFQSATGAPQVQNATPFRPTPAGAVATPASVSSGGSSVPNNGGGNTGSSSGGNDDGGSSKPTDQGPATSGANNGSSKKLAPGAIAGIVVALLVALLLLLVFFRRRHLVALRNRRRDRWRGTAAVSSYDFSDGHESPGTVSARSSFATAYDISTSEQGHGHAYPAAPPVPVPQMAEIRDAHIPGSFSQRTFGSGPISPRSPPPPPVLVSIVQTTDEDPGLDHNTPTPSLHSIASDPYTQGQVISLPPDQLLSLDLPTPMSVRPFSPTESFAFPKPPSSNDSSRRTRGTSVLADGSLSPGDLAVNPFSDPLPPTPSSPGEFEEVEVIRRPFLPTRDDELAVSAGDKVIISHVFDDGWVAVRKVEAHEGKGKGKAAEGGPGLIPVDCLRGKSQELPEFLALKRVSSYGGTS